MSPALAGPEEFDFFDISFQVRGATNQPVANARLRAYSRDWPASFPSDDFAYTDTNGLCRLRLSRGAWTVVAGGGSPYNDWWSGRGLFLASSLAVQSNRTVILKPTHQVRLQFYDRQGALSEAYEIYLAPSALVPNCRMPDIGRTKEGQCQIELGAEEPLACFLTRFPGPATEGYFVFADSLDPHQDMVIRSSEQNLRRVHLDGRSATDASSPGAVAWHLCFPSVDLPRYWAHTAFSLAGAADIYVTPQYMKYCYYISLPDAGRNDTVYYWFNYRGIDLRSQTNATVTAGGPLTRRFHYCPIPYDANRHHFLLGPVTDSFGNELRFYSASEPFRHPMVITDPASGSVVYSNAFPVTRDNLEFCIRQPMPASARFRFEWDLGPYGGLEVIEGALGDPQFRYAYTNLTSSNFAMHLPVWMGSQAGALQHRLEAAYGHWTQVIGERPPVWGRQTNFYVNPVGSETAGWASYYGQELWYSGFTFWDPTEPSAGIWETCALHEIGHRLEADLFATSNCNLSNSSGFRNEALASLLALDALATLHGKRYATPWFAWEAHFFFDNLANAVTNDPNNLRFIVQDYLPQRFGPGITAQFFRSWARACSVLYPQGFSEAETFSALYSALAGENLTWAFNLDGSALQAPRIDEAVAQLNAQGVIRPSLNITIANGRPNVELLGQANRLYSILASAELRQWLEWTNVTCTQLPMTVVDEDAATRPLRFYRAFRD